MDDRILYRSTETAANQIWGAAGHYDFEPMFLAIHSQENRPDFYMNLVIGLAYKYFGEKTLTELFDAMAGDMPGSRCWDDLGLALYRTDRVQA